VNWLRELARKAGTVIFPWPSPGERQAAIEAARAEKEQSRATAGKADLLAADIGYMHGTNHWAETIADQITARYREGR